MEQRWILHPTQDFGLLTCLFFLHVYPELWSGDEPRSVAVEAEIDFPWSGDHSELYLDTYPKNFSVYFKVFVLSCSRLIWSRDARVERRSVALGAEIGYLWSRDGYLYVVE